MMICGQRFGFDRIVERLRRIVLKNFQDRIAIRCPAPDPLRRDWLMRTRLLFVPFVLALIGGCAEKQDEVSKAKSTFTQQGEASYYARSFHGEQTASGETFNQNELVAAHKTLPFGTRVKVTNLDNGKQVTVRIVDRGPFKPGRIIDLSRVAAGRIDLIEDGVVNVKIEKVD
jgi:rare lipoprotein A